MNFVASELSLLLVEPSEVQRRLIARSLHEAGISTVEFAANQASAIAALERYTPDLLVSSMYFDDGTAETLLTHLRDAPAYDEVCFMLISSERKKEYLDVLRQAGVQAMLPKPFKASDLHRAIRTTLDYMNEEELALNWLDINEVRVLLVDDSQLSRHCLIRLLNNMGIDRITEAADGREAIDWLRRQEFDLIITDYNMPEMDGRELTQYIRQHSSQPHLPILMVSSDANEPYLSNITQAGVDALCDKPFDTHNLRALLYRLLEP